MSCLIDSGYKGSITWLGRVMKPVENIRSEALKTAKSNFEVIVGESHSGTTRPACVFPCYTPKIQKFETHASFQSFRQEKMQKFQKVLDCLSLIQDGWVHPLLLQGSLTIRISHQGCDYKRKQAQF